MSLKELDEMEEAVKRNGVKFTVHQQRRFDPDFRTAKAVYDSGTLGDVYAIKNQLYGFNGNMHDWHVFAEEGGGMLYDWGVHLLDQVCFLFPGAKLKSVYADIRNVINKEVDDYFNIMLRFDNNVTATVELGTYYLADKVQDKWFERHWFVAGNKGTAYIDGFFPEGKIVRTTHLLTNVGGKRTMTAAGPTRSFGPAPEGTIVTEPLPEVHTEHRNYFEHYIKAYHGEEEFYVKIPEVRRVLKLMDAVRESGRTGKSIDFE
jgi:predicted dehydrogenase